MQTIFNDCKPAKLKEYQADQATNNDRCNGVDPCGATIPARHLHNKIFFVTYSYCLLSMTVQNAVNCFSFSMLFVFVFVFCIFIGAVPINESVYSIISGDNNIA